MFAPGQPLSHKGRQRDGPAMNLQGCAQAGRRLPGRRIRCGGAARLRSAFPGAGGKPFKRAGQRSFFWLGEEKTQKN